MRKVVCVLAALAVAVAGAAEYFVATDGNDAGDGSTAAPWRTIQRAADAAKAGDTVTVREGVYREWVKPANAGREDAPLVPSGLLGPVGLLTCGMPNPVGVADSPHSSPVAMWGAE